MTEIKYPNLQQSDFSASFVPKITPKDNFHKVVAHKDTWAIVLRGPWEDTWQEFKNEKLITLTHGRKVKDI